VITTAPQAATAMPPIITRVGRSPKKIAPKTATKIGSMLTSSAALETLVNCKLHAHKPTSRANSVPERAVATMSPGWNDALRC